MLLRVVGSGDRMQSSICLLCSSPVCSLQPPSHRLSFYSQGTVRVKGEQRGETGGPEWPEPSERARVTRRGWRSSQTLEPSGPRTTPRSRVLIPILHVAGSGGCSLFCLVCADYVPFFHRNFTACFGIWFVHFSFIIPFFPTIVSLCIFFLSCKLQNEPLNLFSGAFGILRSHWTSR